MAQTSIQKADAVKKGSVVVKVGSSANDFSSLVNVGVLRAPEINWLKNEENIEFDNAPDLKQFSEGDKMSISFDLAEINLTNLEKFDGGIVTLSTVDGTQTSVTDEDVTINEGESVRLANKNGDDSQVSSITVTGSGGTPAYSEGTDYEVFVDAEGYTNLVRIAGGGISDGETVEVDYDYTPASSKKLSFNNQGTKSLISVRIENTDEDADAFRIDLKDATNVEQSTLSFPADDEADVGTMSLELEGTVKEIVDEQQTT